MLGCRERRWKFALLLFNGRVVCASSIGASVGVFRGVLLVLDIPDLFMGSRVKYLYTLLVASRNYFATKQPVQHSRCSSFHGNTNTRAAAPSMATPTQSHLKTTPTPTPTPRPGNLG